jgi:signal transduction histidine kinase
MEHTILCVDDESDNVDALERLFRKKYRVLKATSGKEALRLLRDEPVSLIISDQRMPEMTGVDFLEKTLKSHPETVRILLTGFTDIESVIAAINSGQIYRYVTKPWDPRDLMTAVDRGIERFEMTAELKEKNKALKEALEELKSLDAAKDQFMILINHELKTPLTALLSFLELLRETELNGEQNKYTERIAQSAQRLKEIIVDVLEILSAETGRTPLNEENVEARHVCQAVADALTSLAREKGQNLHIEGKNLKARLDRKIIVNVMKRLLDNAIKFGDKDSDILMTVEGDKSQVVFSVENKGKAIPPSSIEKILKPFSLDEDAMNHSKGLGLGLAVSQALLKRHASHLEIESNKSKTRVSFTIHN